MINIELLVFLLNSITQVRTYENGRNEHCLYHDSIEDWWQGYSKKEPNPLYRTTAQDYGAEKPNIHTMPTVYRTQSSAFTEVNSDLLD